MNKRHPHNGKPGYHPLRKLQLVVNGLRYALVSEFSVLDKAAVSVPVPGSILR